MDYPSYDYEQYIDGTPDTENDIYVDYEDIGLPLLTIKRIRFYETWINCIQPSIIQVVGYIIKLLLWNFVCRIGWIYVIGNRKLPYVEHLMSIFCGLMLLYSMIGMSLTYNVLFNCITYIILLILVKKFRRSNATRKESYRMLSKSKYIGLILGVISLSILPICELVFQHSPKLWHQLRGIHMILAMKSISLAFDLHLNKTMKMPSFLEYSGYMLCPGNCLLGPWIPYEEYIEVFKKQKYDINWLFWVFTNSLAAIVFMVISNCITSMLVLNTKWFTAYRDALAFRFSHYFISFLSQATMSAVGIISTKGLSYSPIFGSLMTIPWRIEYPTSLVDVVINWNIPMHRWLKTYVFQVIKPNGKGLAIFGTYFVSAMLHGLNFQLGAVLLSLGFYTFVEYNVRYKLSQIFNACISAIVCVQPKPSQIIQNLRKIGEQRNICKHLYKSSHSLVSFCNLNFTIFTMFHLSYLGVMFEASTNQEEGYSMEHAFMKWHSLGFLSHWIMLILFFLYFVI